MNYDEHIRTELLQWEKAKRLHPLEQLFWECTLRCNLNCRHCGSDCRTVSLAKDMPLEDFVPVLDELAEKTDASGIMVVTTGGEPLMRKDILDIGRAIRERGFLWGMVSNGMLLTENMLDNLINAGLQSLSLSIDGFEEEHNWMRGNPNSFGRVVSAIKMLAARNITWDVITCVNNKNIDTLPAFHDFLYSIGVRQWRIFTVFPAGRAVGDAEMKLSPKDMRRVMDFIVAVRKYGKIDLEYSCEGFLGEYEHKVRKERFCCISGVHVASIRGNGDISGCLSMRNNYTQGNIYKDSFVDVWNNRFQKFRDREWMKTGGCTDCKVWDLCEGNGMHLRDDDGNLLLCNLKQFLRTDIQSLVQVYSPRSAQSPRSRLR